MEASDFSTHQCGRQHWAGVDHPRPWLGRLEQRAHLTPAFLEEAALVGEGDGVVEAGTGAEMVATFVMRRTEAGGGAWRSRTPAWGNSAA